MPNRAGGSAAVLGLMKRSIASQSVGLREWDVFCRKGSRMTPDLMHSIHTSFREPNSVPEKAMATHSSTLAWQIPWMEEPGRLQSMGSLRVGHD